MRILILVALVALLLIGCGPICSDAPEGLTSLEHGYPGMGAPQLPSWEGGQSSIGPWTPYDIEGWINWPSLRSHRRRNPGPCLDAVVDSPNLIVQHGLREWYLHGMSPGEIHYAEHVRPEIGRRLWGQGGRAAALPPLW